MKEAAVWMLHFISYTVHPKIKMHAFGHFPLLLDLI